MLSAIPMSGSVVLVRVWCGEAEAAVYGIAFQLIAVELLVLGLFLRVIQPHIAGAYALTRSFIQQLSVVVVSGLLGLTVLFLCLGWFLFSCVLPPGYWIAYEVLCLLQAFVTCYALAAVVNAYLIRGRGEARVWAAHVFAVVIYLAAVFLGAARDRRGFAVATTASSAFVLGLGVVGLWSVAKRSRRVNPVSPTKQL